MPSIRNSGYADLPLHTGTVPRWLADRMMVMGTLITESIIQNFGIDEVLTRLSDPLWFQSFGAVMGMDWHSSGITTSVMYALKRGLNPRAKEIYDGISGKREELEMVYQASAAVDNEISEEAMLSLLKENRKI